MDDTPRKPGRQLGCPHGLDNTDDQLPICFYACCTNLVLAPQRDQATVCCLVASWITVSMLPGNGGVPGTPRPVGSMDVRAAAFTFAAHSRTTHHLEPGFGGAILAVLPRAAASAWSRRSLRRAMHRGLGQSPRSCSRQPRRERNAGLAQPMGDRMLRRQHKRHLRVDIADADADDAPIPPTPLSLCSFPPPLLQPLSDYGWRA